MSEQEQFEGEVFFPSEEVVKNANVQDYDAWYKQSIEDPEGFWADRANELEWYKKWDKVLDDSNAPFYTIITIINFKNTNLDQSY